MARCRWKENQIREECLYSHSVMLDWILARGYAASEELRSAFHVSSLRLKLNQMSTGQENDPRVFINQRS